MSLHAKTGLAALTLLALGACRAAAPAPAVATAALAVQALATPAGPNTSTPRLARGADGRAYLSWVERGEARGAGTLWLSVLDHGIWQAAQRVAGGDDWFLNWADFPGVAILADGTICAHWLAKSGAGTYAYDIHFALSRDGGATWTSAAILHDDRRPAEHGFASLVPLDEDRFAAVWLDGRATVDGGAMQLYFRTIASDGSLGAEVLLDPRVCDCCPTALVRVFDDELLCVYRDRSENETRDIWFVRGGPTGFTEPTAVHADGWVLPGCPVNGPRLAMHDDAVAAVWYTGAGGAAGRVRVAVAVDGAPFESPTDVDDGAPEGRVGAAYLDDGSLLVSWLEHGLDGPDWRVRRLGPDGPDAALQVTAISSDRSSGSLQILADGSGALLAWTATDDTGKSYVATACLR